MTNTIGAISPKSHHLRPEPVLWFGGAVSNRQAVSALRAAAEEAGIPANQVIGTGDAIAYAGDPAGTLDELQAWGVSQIQGNCEESIIAQADDCGCGFDSGSTCDLLTVNWYRHCVQSVRPDQQAWLASWPRQLLVSWNGLQVRVVHGAPEQVNRFVFPSEDEHSLAQMIGAADAIVCGHSGLPWSRLVGGKLWHNAGSIGMPANDGTPRTWYAIWTPQSDGSIAVSHHALCYDVDGAVADMEAAGLTQGYDRALRSGIWPSDDVLTAAERARAGEAIEASCLSWRPGVG